MEYEVPRSYHLRKGACIMFKSRFYPTLLLQLSDSLEIAIAVHNRKMDLFFLYPDDEGGNGSWVGGMVSWKREKLRYDVYIYIFKYVYVDGHIHGNCNRGLGIMMCVRRSWEANCSWSRVILNRFLLMIMVPIGRYRFMTLISCGL